MIILVCGPSGSGKTTLLARLATCLNCAIIPVVVSRKQVRGISEVGRIEVTLSEFNKLAPSLQFQYAYDGGSYGFSLSAASPTQDCYIFIDYPGEYPACSELRHLSWRGILVLPPSCRVLITRLSAQKKYARIVSAVKEYKECLQELCSGDYPRRTWKIYTSGDATSTTALCNAAESLTLFAKDD